MAEKFNKEHAIKTVVGAIRNVLFTKGSFCIICIVATEGRGKGRQLIVKGNLHDPEPKKLVSCTGIVTYDKDRKQYQMQATEVVYKTDHSNEGIANFLKGVPGVGPVFAEKMAEAWGRNTFEKLKLPAAELSTELEKIGVKLQGRFLEQAVEWLELHRGTQEIEAMLCSLEVGSFTTATILQWMKDKGYVTNDVARSKKMLKENIYNITELKGIGFKTASKIGDALGTPKSNPARIRAGVLYTIKEETRNGGHACLTANDLIRSCVKLLLIPKDLIIPIAKQLVADGFLALHTHDPTEISAYYRTIAKDIEEENYDVQD